MNPNMTQSLARGGHRLVRGGMTMIRRITALARKVAGFFAECNYAQRRAVAWRMAADTYVPHGDKAPDNYAEFLFRTSGVLLHEPAARHRGHGHLVG